VTRRERLTAVISGSGLGFDDPDPVVRRLAAAANVEPVLIDMLRSDPDPSVRRQCAETLGRSDLDVCVELEAALLDSDTTVREAAVNALGEIADPRSVDALIAAAAAEDNDKMIREAAVASLGAIGDERAVTTLLDLIETGPPQVRRRCVPALSVFEGEAVEAALRAAAQDRNPMVREAAEMVVGRAVSESGP